MTVVKALSHHSWIPVAGVIPVRGSLESPFVSPGVGKILTGLYLDLFLLFSNYGFNFITDFTLWVAFISSRRISSRSSAPGERGKHRILVLSWITALQLPSVHHGATTCLLAVPGRALNFALRNKSQAMTRFLDFPCPSQAGSSKVCIDWLCNISSACAWGFCDMLTVPLGPAQGTLPTPVQGSLH